MYTEKKIISDPSRKSSDRKVGTVYIARIVISSKGRAQSGSIPRERRLFINY